MFQKFGQELISSNSSWGDMIHMESQMPDTIVLSGGPGGVVLVKPTIHDN